jgi:repressor LexA
MSKLHPTQEKLLKLLEDTIDDPMTVRELQERLVLSTPSLVMHHIQQLEKKGYLKRSPDNPQDYHLLKNPEKPIVYLNMYGLVQCGPSGSILEGTVLDRMPVAAKLLPFPADEAFLVRARGDSMEPLIHEGDIVIARKVNATENGRLVVCVNNGEALIKRYYQPDSEHVLLESENKAYGPFMAGDFTIEGEVKGVISAIG